MPVCNGDDLFEKREIVQGTCVDLNESSNSSYCARRVNDSLFQYTLTVLASSFHPDTSLRREEKFNWQDVDHSRKKKPRGKMNIIKIIGQV